MWGIFLEFIIGAVVLRWNTGREIVNCFSTKVTTFLGFTEYGSNFVYSYLGGHGNNKLLNVAALNFTAQFGPEVTNITRTVADTINESGINFPFVFKILSVIYFIAFTVQMLIYWGTLQTVILKMGWFFSVTIGTTAAESMNAAGNIFLSMTEAPLLIRPFLNDMTKSEIHAVMTGGGFLTIVSAGIPTHAAGARENRFLGLTSWRGNRFSCRRRRSECRLKLSLKTRG